MNNDDVTQDDLLRALIDALEQPAGNGGLSFYEIQEATGWHTVKIRSSLKKLQKQGRLVVGKAPRQNIAGSYSPVPVYAIKQDNVPIEQPAESNTLEAALVSPPLLPASS